MRSLPALHVRFNRVRSHAKARSREAKTLVDFGLMYLWPCSEDMCLQAVMSLLSIDGAGAVS
jgi:hypothetical protein